MGVYIKGMEMPKEGTFNIVHIYDDGHVSMPFWGKGMQIVSGITAVPVPPHGRCIDADAVFKRLQKQAMSVWGNSNPRYQIVLEVMDAIRFAPTIIPASEEAGE